MIERTVACDCGKVQVRARGAPITSCICYCDDCQAGGRQLESLGAAGTFRDAFGGSPYLVYRNDRIACVAGTGLLQGVKLREDAPTTRFIATCCKTPMFLKYGPGWWTSAYRARFGDSAPPVEFRSQVQFAPAGADLPRDVPVYRSFPLRLFARLSTARIGMLFGRLRGVAKAGR